MSSNPNDLPPNVGILADDLTCTTSILQLLLGSSQGDTESRNVLLAHLGSLMGPLLALMAPEPQAISSPALPVNTPPADIVQDELAPATTAALVDHNPAEPSPVTIIVQEPDASPTLDLPTFNMLPDTPSSMSTSTSTIVPSHTPSPLLPGHLDPPSPLMPTILPNSPVSAPDAAMPAYPTTPTCQTLNTSESGLDRLPADSPLTGHTSLDCPSNADHLRESGLQWMAASPSTCPSPAIIVTSLEPSALEPWGSNVHVVVNFAILVLYTFPSLGPGALHGLYSSHSHPSSCAHVKSPSPSLTLPPSTSGMSSSNLVPTPSTSSSPPSLPSFSNAEMLVVLHKALHAATEVLDQASKGHIASEKALGKGKLHD
ncbi:hypothetical protein BKA82DRAFT_24244 [Pisolithus tinctorius]|uniref:Uncharacterized protein n=1 Tax=Pisolithus tinctorius Marx 270 TaxID=870435 RepID=A0A0C3PGS2_PISTI|nr:hypothetical protein BKA82DRAFT_24244 [Pisolithus tinctorius]KIO07164.1 hypothetical protein M404DRAFT_24244 [Pisolithus tinctorius Marx 270]